MLLRNKWALLILGATLYFAPTRAAADCSCADIITVIGICNGDGCANIQYSMCSTNSFSSCNTCVSARRFTACCDGGEFFQDVKSGADAW